jgi:hypothetical protein
MTGECTTEQPNIKPIGKDAYRLVEPFCYKEICVPMGFVFDGASIPRFLWTLSGLTPDGLHRAAALIHDYLYHHKGKIPNSKVEYTRREADSIFRELLTRSCINSLNVRRMYWAVRLFGYFYWKN